MTAPVALIAGAGAAGAATAARLSVAGYRVVVVDSRLEAATAAVAPVLADGGTASAWAVDLLDLDAVSALRDDVLAAHGRVDVLVHLVGGWRGSPTLDLASVANWNALHPPIVGTLATITAVFGDDVRASESGRVFMVTSTAAARPTAGNIAYAAAKSAAEAWMAGVAHFLRDCDAAAVIVAVKALLTPAMAAAERDRDWSGYTPTDVLASAIADACTSTTANGARLDLTTGEYSAS